MRVTPHPRRYDCAGLKNVPGRLLRYKAVFLILSCILPPRGDTKKQKKTHTHTSLTRGVIQKNNNKAPTFQTNAHAHSTEASVDHVAARQHRQNTYFQIWHRGYRCGGGWGCSMVRAWSSRHIGHYIILELFRNMFFY